MKWTARFIFTVFINLCSNRKTTRPREEACQPIHIMNLQYVAVINDSPSDSLIVACTLSKFFDRSRGIILHKGALSSAVMLLGEGEKEKA